MSHMNDTTPQTDTTPRADVLAGTGDAAELDLGIEELDGIIAPDGFSDFATGFATGVALVGLGVAAT